MKKQKLKRMNDKVFSYRQALYMAFYSGRLYVDVKKRWRGFGLKYLILLIMIATIPLSIHVIYKFNQAFNDQMIAVINKIPPLTVHNGQLLFDKPMPYFIKNKKGNTAIIIDTTGKVTAIDNKYPELMMLITKENIYFQPPDANLFPASETSLELNKPSVITETLEGMNDTFVAREWVQTSGILNLKWIGSLAVYPIIASLLFGSMATLCLVFTMIAKGIAQMIFKTKLTFKEACRLIVVASTAQILLYLLSLAVEVTFPGMRLILGLMTFIYFGFAVLTIRRESNQLVRT